MSIQYLFANNASTTLASPISASSTTISVYPGQGALFPSPTSGQGFTVTLTDAATGKLTEIMLCTNRTGDTFTVTRAQEGTNALAWGAGDFVNNFVTAGSATNWIQSSAFGSPPGTYGTATQIPVLTVNASGQLTAISTVTTTANYCAGGWNAATNTPTLVSSIGQNGQYYVVTVAGTTNLNGYDNWQIGDQALFANGAWLRVAGSESAAFHDITVSSLTGYMYANGSSLVTASPTIPNSGLAHSTITVNGTTLTLGDVGDTITANTPNAVTFNNSGSGTSSGNSFNGGTAITVSYNTIGAPSVTGTGASGTWGIGITGNAASATVATNLQGGSAYALPYQSAAGTTAYLSAGTAGYVLTTNGTGSAPTWTSVGSAAVTTFNAGTTGFTPSTATSGAITLAGTLNAAHGGTGATSLTGYVYGNGTGTMTASATIPTTALSGTITNSQLANSSITVNGTSIALGGSGTITAANPNALTIGAGLSGGSYDGSSAVTIANTGVLTFSGGTTGLTPSSATNGAVTLAGTLNVANGGTGLTSLTAGYIPYGNGTGAFASNSGFTFIGTTLTSPVLVVNSTTSTTPNLTFNASNSGITSGATIANNYLQTVIQNKSGTSGASTNYVLSNDLGTDSSYYGEFGMNSSGFTASGTIPDFYSINNGVYFSGHDGDISVGSGNGYKLYFPWGSTGASAHVINASGALGFSTNRGTSAATSGTTGYGTSGQALVSGGSSAAPSWQTLPTSGGGTGISSYTANQVLYASSTTTLAQSANLQFNGTTLTVANDASIHGLTVGLGGGSVSTNTAVGASALAANTSGNYSVALGYSALTANTSGVQNAAVGSNTMVFNTTGGYNTTLGTTSLFNNQSGSYNTAIGNAALYSNTTASNNTAVGYQSAYSNTTGHDNIAIGYNSQYGSGDGSYNVSVGRGAIYGVSSGSGSYNSALGYLALSSSTTGNYNVAVGSNALQANTTASENTAVGYQALYTNTTGAVNVAVGKNALQNSNSSYNTAVGGGGALYSATSGAYNTAVGYGSGYNITTGSKNTILGSYNGNQGGLDIRTSSNYIVLSDGDGNPRGYCTNNSTWYFVAGGNNPSGRFYSPSATDSNPTLYVDKPSATTSTSQVFMAFTVNSQGALNGQINGNGANQAAFGSTSDARLKENITEIPAQLSNIMALRPVEFDYIASEGGGHQIGFIAQEMEAVFPDSVGERADGMKTVTGWNKTEAILVKAIQELKAEFDAYKASHP